MHSTWPRHIGARSTQLRAELQAYLFYTAATLQTFPGILLLRVQSRLTLGTQRSLGMRWVGAWLMLLKKRLFPWWPA